MNEIVNNFLLAGDKFMSEMQDFKTTSIYIWCLRTIYKKKRIEKFKEKGDS